MQDLWLITVNNQEAKKELLRGLEYKKSHVTIRKYDDIMLEQRTHQDRMKNVTKMIMTIGLRKDGKSKAMSAAGRNALSELLVRESETDEAVGKSQSEHTVSGEDCSLLKDNEGERSKLDQ